MEPADPACPPSSLQTLIGCRKHQSTGRGGCDRERLCAWLLGSRPDLCWPCSLVGLDSGPGPRSQGRSNDPSRLALPWGWRHCNACATLLLFSLPSCPLTYVMSFAGGAGQAWLGPSLSPPLGEARLQSTHSVLPLCARVAEGPGSWGSKVCPTLGFGVRTYNCPVFSSLVCTSHRYCGLHCLFLFTF